MRTPPINQYVRRVLDEGLKRDWFLLGIGKIFIRYHQGRIDYLNTLDDPDLCPSTPNFYPGIWCIDRVEGEFPIRPGQFSRGFGIQLHHHDVVEFPEGWEPCLELATVEDEVEPAALPELKRLLDLLFYSASKETPLLMVDHAQTLTVHQAWNNNRFGTCRTLIRCSASA